MAVSVCVLAVVDTELRELLSLAFRLFFYEGPKEALATDRWEGIKLIGGAIAIAIASVASLVASFVLPFTQRRLDTFVPLLLMAHVIIIAGSHFVGIDANSDQIGDHVRVLIGVAYTLWAIGYLACIRYQWISPIVSNHQSTPREGMTTGFIATLAILICTLGLEWHWSTCYAFAAINAVFVTRIIVRGK